MEILFKNTYIQTEDWVKAGNRLNFLRRPFFIICHCVGLLMLLWAIYAVIFLRIIYVLSFFLSIWWFAFNAALYAKANRIVLKRSVEMNGRNAGVISEVTENCVQFVCDNGSTQQMQFDNIKRGYVTEKYIFLWSKANILYTFSRNGFLIGNEEDFLRFLREKGIKIK